MSHLKVFWAQTAHMVNVVPRGDKYCVGYVKHLKYYSKSHELRDFFYKLSGSNLACSLLMELELAFL